MLGSVEEEVALCGMFTSLPPPQSSAQPNHSIPLSNQYAQDAGKRTGGPGTAQEFSENHLHLKKIKGWYLGPGQGPLAVYRTVSVLLFYRLIGASE